MYRVEMLGLVKTTKFLTQRVLIWELPSRMGSRALPPVSEIIIKIMWVCVCM